MIEPRQSTTVPKVSKTRAFTEGSCATALSIPCKAIAAMPIPPDFSSRLRVIAKLPANYYSELKQVQCRAGDRSLLFGRGADGLLLQFARTGRQ